MTTALVSLNIKDKLNDDEQQELQRRLLAIMEQMYMEGISAGRELNREDLHTETEKYIKQKIAFLTNYFMMEEIWHSNPPAGYDAKRVIPTVEAPTSDEDDYGRINKKLESSMENGEMPSTPNPDEEMIEKSDQKPDWAKNEAKPDWIDKKKPFD